MTFIEKMKMQAKQDIKTIVLPESKDIRTLEATEIVLKEGFANIILIGNPQEINELAEKNNINLNGAQIVNPATSADFSKYANDLYELRKNKGMTLDQAKELLKTNSRYFATMMVKEGDADGFVSGASHPTSDTLRPALQILKAAPGTKLVSAFFVMVLPDKEFGDDGVFIFADSGLNEYPDADALSEIAISSSKSFKELIGDEPKVAMLSYSTLGSGKGPNVDKVREATAIAKEKAPELDIDGELQADASLVKSVAAKKCPDSKVAGQANVLVFPDLNAGNIAYKLVQRLAKAEAIGPISQGVALPVNDLSRGCSAEDVANVVAITAIQAQMVKK